MNPLVWNLYKRVVYVGKHYPHPEGWPWLRRKAKEKFHQNRDLTDEKDIKRAIARGRWYIENELIGVIKLKKYRTMKHRYVDPESQ